MIGKVNDAGPDDLGAALAGAGLDVRPIRRIADATPETFRAAIAERVPTLFGGLTDEWPARLRWEPRSLCESHGDLPVTALMNLPVDGVLFDRDQRDYQQELRFGEFIETMMTASAQSPCYLAYAKADKIFHREDYDFARLLGDAGNAADTRVWIGSTGTRSMLHSDLKDNLFCQVWGEKYFVLMPWEHSPSAYPFPDNLVNSRLDLAKLDLDRYPKLRSAVLYAGPVRPGEVLYMPKGCWHDVRSRTPSISINHWFGEPLTFGDYARLLLRLGPRAWAAATRDFVRYGLLGRKEKTLFFFSPASTGKRLFDLVTRGNFSRDNDPSV